MAQYASVFKKNYSNYIYLYTDPATESGLQGSLQFEIKLREGIVSVWSEDMTTCTYGIIMYNGNAIKVDVSGYLNIDNGYHINHNIDTLNSISPSVDWSIEVNAFYSDENGNLIYSGTMNKTLAVPQAISNIEITTQYPYYGQNIILSWPIPQSSNNIDYPIQGTAISASYGEQSNPGYYTNTQFGEQQAMINEDYYATSSIILSPNETRYELIITPELFAHKYNRIKIEGYLYWQSLEERTADYFITPIFGSAGQINFTIVDSSTIILYVKDSEGNFLLGETMFIKDFNGNWRQAESIQQN